ncbi:MAG: DAK2 domain-containing protein [Acutalibacteraceae bacterium]
MTDSEKLIKSLFRAYNKLALSKKELDEMNVFPVADGDTGSNMTRTMKAGAEAVKNETYKSPAELLKICSKAMLRNARGNSGVILSVLFKGFSDYINEFGKLEAVHIYAAFDFALKQAAEALSAPIFDGTILCVAEAARDAAEKSDKTDFVSLWQDICENCRKAAENTCSCMPELKNGKFPDSGAQGLYLIILAVNEVLTGKTDHSTQKPYVSFNKLAVKKEDKYIYCTEFIVMKEHDFPVSLLENNLKKIGNSVAVVSDDGIIKVHLHTNVPNRAIEHALSFGALTDIKIDNMAVMKNTVQS